MKKPLSKTATRFTSREAIPLYRTVNILAVLSRYALMKDIDIALLIAGSGIQATDLDDPDFLATPEQEIILMQNITQLVPDPGLGLLIGSQYHIGIFGKVGAAAINSNTLLDAIKVFFKYSEVLLTYFHFEIIIKDNLAFATMNELIDLKDIRLFVCEREFASIYRIVSDLLGEPIKLTEIRFAYPEPKHVSSYQEIFQCPLVFNAENHVVVFDKSYLYKQLPMANPLAKKSYEKECKELSLRIKRQETMSKRVVQEILYRRNKIPDFNQLARFLNTSPRTLGRRLKEEGTSYKNLVSGIRKNKAIKLLRTSSLSIQQIAEEIGYNDLPNFYRAFKRWTGKTPGDFRTKAT